jgi:hypothetical protein
MNLYDHELPEEDLSKYYSCRACGKHFDSFGDMQRHILLEHFQKGDIPAKRSDVKRNLGKS